MRLVICLHLYADSNGLTDPLQALTLGGMHDEDMAIDEFLFIGHAEKGDEIALRIMVNANSTSGHVTSFVDGTGYIMAGVITDIFQVYHAKSWERLAAEAAVETGDARTNEIRRCLSFFDFQWTLPDFNTRVPVSEAALVQPSDVVTVLRPILANNDDRLVMVSRFLRVYGARDKFLFIIPGNASLETIEHHQSSPAPLHDMVAKLTRRRPKPFADVCSAKIKQEHDGPRGWEKYENVPLFGKLQNATNDDYVVYRGTISIDGFPIPY